VFKTGKAMFNLRKCPYCDFKNIYQESIEYHIKHKNTKKIKAYEADNVGKKLYWPLWSLESW